MNSKKHLKGSWSRDEFKYWHKYVLPGFFTASDLDLGLTGRNPNRLLCHLDYKQFNDSLTKDEVIMYNEYLKKGIKTFIIKGDLSKIRDKTIENINCKKIAFDLFNAFQVYEYLQDGKLNLVSNNYFKWECELRNCPYDWAKKEILNNINSNNKTKKESFQLELESLFKKE